MGDPKRVPTPAAGDESQSNAPDAPDAPGLETIPPAFALREKLVELRHPPGTTVMVQRWSTRAAALVLEHISGVLGDMPVEMRSNLGSADNLSIALAIAPRLGRRLNNVIALSVRQEDEEKVAGTDGDDIIPLIVAILEVNDSVIQGLKKNAGMLLKALSRMWAGSKESTP